MLEDLDDRLHCVSRLDVFGVELAVVLKVDPLREIAVVRNREHIAAGARIDALFLKPPPKALDVGLVEVAVGQGRHTFVPEHHIAVEVFRRRASGPLVARKRREPATIGAVVRVFRSLNDPTPDIHARIHAVHTVWAAEGGVADARGQYRRERVEPDEEGADFPWRSVELQGVTVVLAIRIVVRR